MSTHIIETVVFRLNDGVSRSDFLRAVEASSAFVTSVAGFVSRRLSCADDGTWIEHIEWTDMNSAEAAAAMVEADPRNADFLSAIDGQSIKLMHSKLEISVG